MEYQSKENDDSGSEGNDSCNWNTECVLECAKTMSHLKEKIYETASSNIKRAQEKDKFYYDKKHSNSKVTLIHTILNVFQPPYLAFRYSLLVHLS